MMPQPPNSPTLNAADLLARIGNDMSVLRQMAQLLAQSAPTWQLELQEAIASRDVERLRLAAHQIKGAMLTFAAPRASHYAQKLEDLAKAGDFTTANNLMKTLMLELIELQHAVQQCASDANTS